MQWSPSPSLSGLVKHYLVVEAERAPSLNYRLFSDGNPGIVFHFGDPLIQTPSGELQATPKIPGEPTTSSDSYRHSLPDVSMTTHLLQSDLHGKTSVSFSDGLSFPRISDGQLQPHGVSDSRPQPHTLSGSRPQPHGVSSSWPQLHGVSGSWLQPRSFLYGQITRYNDWLSGGKLGMLVVVLQPTGLSSLLRMPAHQLNDSMVKLVDLFGQEALDLEEQVMSACQPGPVAGNTFGRTFYQLHPAIQYVEQFLLKRVAASLIPDPFVSKALQAMVDARGMLKMEELLRKIPVTERQLERKFKTTVGMGPKKIADIIKFQHFLKLLQQHPAGGNLTDVIYEGGYYDQAHLNNYFKKMVGLTPRQYKTNPHLLAVNFMQVPG